MLALHVPAKFQAPPTSTQPICLLFGGVFLLESIIWCKRIVHCPEFGGCPLFGSSKCIESMGIAVGASTVVRYIVDVRYSECPLMGLHCMCSNHFQCIFFFVN